MFLHNDILKGYYNDELEISPDTTVSKTMNQTFNSKFSCNNKKIKSNYLTVSSFHKNKRSVNGNATKQNLFRHGIYLSENNIFKAPDLFSKIHNLKFITSSCLPTPKQIKLFKSKYTKWQEYLDTRPKKYYDITPSPDIKVPHPCLSPSL